MHILFWLGIAWLGYVAAGYPALLWLLGQFRSFRAARNDDYRPKVSVLISAHNEAKDIGWKLAETLRWDYPHGELEVLVASDASDDGTDTILSQVHDPRLRFIRLEQRSGKQIALNRLAEIASGELLFFTDANTHIAAPALRRMVSYFADQRVGCVTGVESNVEEADESALSFGGRSYLDYESWLNQQESRLGSVLVCDGSIFCLRRSLFVPLQSDVANDLESPLRVGAAGYAVVFDPALRSVERATCSLLEEFGRRRRICAQGLLGMWRLRACLRGMRAWQFVSRKLLRWLLPVPLVATVVSGTALYTSQYAVAEVIAALLILLVGFVAAVSGSSKTARIAALPFCFLWLISAALIGLLDTCCGRRYGIWEQPSLARGAHSGQ